MTEKNILLEVENLNKFFGVREANLSAIINSFPRLKIIARGEIIKVIGDPNEITIFEGKLQAIIEHFEKYNNINIGEIKEILSSENNKTERDTDKTVLLYNIYGKPIRSKTKNQRVLVEQCEKNDLMFALGPAGTGKTYTAIALAVMALKSFKVKRIILSRPAVEAGENLGFLPGDLRDKLDPYLQPLYDALLDMIPHKKLEKYIEEKVVQIAPLAFMRGRTLSDAFVILDEAQNATYTQLKMFLTRMGENSKFVVTGDLTQIDLLKKNESGLISAQKILSNIDDIAFVHFGKEDIVRHKIVSRIVDAYEKNENK